MLTTSFPKFRTDSHAPWILSIACNLRRRNNSVKVVAPSATDLARYADFDGVEVLRFRYLLKSWECVAYGANIPSNLASSYRARFAFPFFVAGFLYAAAKHLNDCDIVHAQFGYSGIFAVVGAKLMGRRTPIVVSFYGRDVAHARRYAKLYKWLFAHAQRVLVLSEDMRSALLEAQCPDEKVRVHHLGVNCDHFAPNIRDSETKEVTFLVVANFVEKKGISVTIEAFARLLKERSDVRLTLVGRGPLEDSLRRQTRIRGIQDQVRFVNNYEARNPRECVLQEMKRADVFILAGISTPDDYGGTPIALMEAGAMELPAITTRNAGNTEVVKSDVTGVVVAENDVEELYDAMNCLVSDPDKRQRLGRSARRYILEEFNERRQVKQLEEIYHEALS